MALINGTGLSRRGWSHGEDGSATATLWLTLFFVPVLPLRRDRMQILDPTAVARAAGSEGDSTGTVRMLGTYHFDVPVRVGERLSLSLGEILRTYTWTYLLLPILCIWPGLVFVFVSAWTTEEGKQDPLMVPMWVMGSFVVLAISNALVVLLTAVRRARGVPPRLKQPKQEKSLDPLSDGRISLNERYPVGQGRNRAA